MDDYLPREARRPLREDGTGNLYFDTFGAIHGHEAVDGPSGGRPAWRHRLQIFTLPSDF